MIIIQFLINIHQSIGHVSPLIDKQLSSAEITQFTNNGINDFKLFLIKGEQWNLLDVISLNEIIIVDLPPIMKSAGFDQLRQDLIEILWNNSNM